VKAQKNGQVMFQAPQNQNQCQEGILMYKHPVRKTLFLLLTVFVCYSTALAAVTVPAMAKSIWTGDNHDSFVATAAIQTATQFNNS